MVGPSKLLHFPDSPHLVGIGLFLVGGCRGVIVGFSVAEAIEGASKVYRHHETRVVDLISSVYCFVDGLAMLVFPIIGSSLSELWSFGSAMEVIGALMVITFVGNLGCAI